MTRDEIIIELTNAKERIHEGMAGSLAVQEQDTRTALFQKYLKDIHLVYCALTAINGIDEIHFGQE